MYFFFALVRFFKGNIEITGMIIHSNNMVNKYKYIVQCNFQDLSEAQMQKIAAEMNLSETVFLRNKEKNGSFSKGITIAEVQCTWKKTPH